MEFFNKEFFIDLLGYLVVWTAIYMNRTSECSLKPFTMKFAITVILTISAALLFKAGS